MSKKINSFFVFIFLFGFVFFLSMTTHFFFVSNDFGHDASIFAYVGYAITQGKALYTEAWDNKGPLLYMINALGVVINYRYGIYFLELITLFTSIIFLYKTANLFVPRGSSVACAIISMIPLLPTLDGGNLSEEYALPFTILAFYYISKFIKNNYYLKKYEMVIVGMCVSAIVLLRLNILAFLGCAILGVIIILIKSKNYKILWTVFIYALIGFVLFTTPFVVYLISKGALKYCIDTVYLGVLSSFSRVSFAERMANVNSMILSLTQSGAHFIIIIFVYFFYFTKSDLRKDFNRQEPLNTLCWISFFGFIVTLLANSISGVRHLHYFMTFVPVLIIPAAWLSKRVVSFLKNHNKRDKSIACLLLVFLLTFPLILNSAVTISSDIYTAVSADDATVIRGEEVSGFITENSETTDTILVFGDYSSAVSSYYRAKRLAASNYFYYANGIFNDKAKTEFADKIFDDIKKNQPKIIMFDTKTPSTSDAENKMEDFVEHCSDKSEWNNFINENYTVQNNEFEYIIYLHK